LPRGVGRGRQAGRAGPDRRVVRPARRVDPGGAPGRPGRRRTACHRDPLGPGRGAGRLRGRSGRHGRGTRRRQRDAGRRGGGRMSSRVAWQGLIAEYRDLLPVTDDAPVISLGEGATPLIPAPVLSKLTGCRVYLKVEGANPTGSFKDRGMTVAVSMAAARGARAVSCASAG